MTLLKNLRLHAKFILLKYATRLAYRTDFVISLITAVLYQLISPFVLAIIYYSGGQYPGWTIPEVLLLMGVISTARGFSYMFFNGLIWNLRHRVQHGLFDFLLLKPVNTLWFALMDAFDEEDIGQFLGGVCITVFAVFRLSLHFSFLRFLAFLTLFIVGLFFFFGLALLGGSLTIRYVQVQRYGEFLDLIGIFGSYPKTIYTKAQGLFFTLFVPIMIAGHYPASVLLGKTLEGMWIGILGTFAFFFFTFLFWQRTLKYYTSAGG